MCGIFGYLGTSDKAGEIVLEGLKRLEYRGYDSWGVAVKNLDGKIYIEKHIGKIGDAELPNMHSHAAIGHTRWATHGGVTDENAHPHTDEERSVIIVHNGIVENYEEIKQELEASGHVFASETDSEIIAHLIEEERKSNKLVPAIDNVRNRIKGMNAVIAFVPDENLFVIFKNGSPLVIGQNDDEMFLASDPSAINFHTKNVYFVEDNDLLLVKENEIKLFDVDLKEQEFEFTTLQYDAEQAVLGDYAHFMIKEISEQPRILTEIAETQKGNVQKAARLINDAFGTYLIGCGTAAYACLTGTYLFSKIANKHVNFSIGSEFEYLLDFITDKSLVMPLSQSGETIDIISSIKKAKERDAKILTLVNVLGSTLYRMADEKLLLNAGPEKAVASTKAYTAKVALLFLIAHELNGTFDQSKVSLLKAANATKKLIQNANTIRELSETIKLQKNLFVLGRGVSYPAALEAALKIKEVSYIHAEGFAGGELKHGVIALVEDNTPVIIFNPKDETYDDTLSAAHEVKARGAHIIGISSDNHDIYDTFIHVDYCEEATHIPNVVVGQLLGYYLSIAKGIDPDKPRNLAKSVTVK